MNASLIFYAELLGGALLIAIAWLALKDLIHGKKFRLDSSPNKQQSVLTVKTAWLQFGYRSAISVVLLLVGITVRSSLIIAAAFVSLVIQMVTLHKMLALAKTSAG